MTPGYPFYKFSTEILSPRKAGKSSVTEIALKIYDVPMKFVHKLIHGGPVNPSYEPLQVLQQCMVLSEKIKIK